MKTLSTPRFFSGAGWPSEPFAFRYKLRDIPNAVVGAINALPPQCVAVAVHKDVHAASVERAARRRGIRVMWVR